MNSSNQDVAVGPLFVGLCFAIFFFGMICMQTINYTKSFAKDTLYTKTRVLGLWYFYCRRQSLRGSREGQRTVDFLFTMCLCVGVYTMGVSDDANYDASQVSAGLRIAMVAGSLLHHIAQAYYVFRLYQLSGGLLSLAIPLWTVAAILGGLSLSMAAKIQQMGSVVEMGRTWHWLIDVTLFGDAILDLICAGLLSFYYLRTPRTDSRHQVSRTLSELVHYTIRTGLSTSLIAMAAAVSFAVNSKNYIWVMFYIVVPSSFVDSMIVNVNNRKTDRSVRSSTAVIRSVENHRTQTTVIQFSRSVVLTRDFETGDQIRDRKDSDIQVEERDADEVARRLNAKTLEFVPRFSPLHPEA
ncbi:unnamed protein product [Mycena citricolor]|uniref:DUF6534 domain-containing protein n=1 Tax=Mycena citricolor TaxID=2018698 RepID=A0AAD2HHX7_9AGAR|nr:unnamed protein product [Mycena citricolor]